MKSLNQWLEYIAETHPSEIEMGLDRIRRVFKNMSVSERSDILPLPKIVVVSGTNGKGSTIALIESGLVSMGLTVGSYTSPHIRTYNERVKINALPVSDELIISAFENVDIARANVPLTYFEFGTLAAFDVLLGSELDVILLEVGLGGRLDAVNIIDSDLAVITSVGLDHVDWLGSSLEGIGLEKAGILRQKGRAILGENLPESVHQQAKILQCNAMTVHQDIIRTNQGVMLSTKSGAESFPGFPSVRLPENNILIATQAIKLLSEDSNHSSQSNFSYESLIECFNRVQVEGRFEEVKNNIIDSNQRVFLDVGHNPHAATYLLSVLKDIKIPGVVVNAVYSSLVDKDVASIVDVLSPIVDTWFLAPLDDSRALKLVDLETAVGEFTKNMLSFESLSEALQAALAPNLDDTGVKPKSITLVFGSFHVIDAAKAYFESL